MNKQAASDMIDNAGNILFDNMTTEQTKQFLKDILNAGNPLTATATALDIANTAAQTSTDSAEITVTGAVVGQSVRVTAPLASMNANSFFSGFVSSANKVTIRFHNYSAAAINPAAGDFKIEVLQ